MTPLSRRLAGTRADRVCIAAALPLCLAACQAPGSLTAQKCPTIPQPRPAEPAPAKPDTDEALALAPGHWEWTVGSYEWVPPAWLPRPPHPHWHTAPALWQYGYWTPDGGACVWTAGRFVS